MNTIYILVLKILRKVYQKIYNRQSKIDLEQEKDPDKISRIIYTLLTNDKPCMIARFGSTEMSALMNYLGVNSPQHSIWKFIQGKAPQWWWDKKIMNQMQEWSGFFPPTPENMQRFGEVMIDSTKEVDILASWLKDEKCICNYCKSSPLKIWFIFLDPFWSKYPWTRALQGKKVLVVHPFSELIETQYKTKRETLFKNPEILPSFQLKTIKAVQSLGGQTNNFKDWFEALEYMKQEIDKCDYDICLIGCGAYGFPLAAHVKRMGKKAIHMGGSLQLLFGIIGKRWENPQYGSVELKEENKYPQLINENWVRPQKKDIPINKDKVENGCYW